MVTSRDMIWLRSQLLSRMALWHRSQLIDKQRPLEQYTEKRLADHLRSALIYKRQPICTKLYDHEDECKKAER
jgi:hypothetical protein